MVRGEKKIQTQTQNQAVSALIAPRRTPRDTCFAKSKSSKAISRAVMNPPGDAEPMRPA